MFRENIKAIIKISQQILIIGLFSIACSAFAGEQTRFNLAKHYSPIIYQHVDTTGEHSLGGRSDQIMNFNYDGAWSGDVKWEHLESNVGPASIYYTVVESTNYWFIYYAIYHPRDWSNLVEYFTMHENDMEAVVLMVAKGSGYPGNLIAAMTMTHNAWVEYPIDPSVIAINYDGTTDQKGHRVTFIQNKSVPEFISNGYHPRVYVQSRGHGVFMDANHDPILNAGNAMGIDNWNLTGFPKLTDYDGTGLVHYCSSDNLGETIYNIRDKLIDSKSGAQNGSPDIYGSRWIKYKLISMSELWDKREWKKDNQIGKEWMFVIDDNGFLAFYGPSPGNNEAHPPWSIPDHDTYDNPPPLTPSNITSPGEIFYDPLTAFKQHFSGLNIPSDEKYVYNPYLIFETKKLLASDGEDYDWFGTSVSISADTVAVGAWGDDDNGGYSGSVYVFDRNEGGSDSWGEVKKITAFDGADSDYFGYSVSINADTLVVGVYGDDGGGSVYIYERNEGGLDKWGFVKKIIASDRENGDQFGYSVSISGSMVIIGAPMNSTEKGLLSGSAYIFERNQGGTNNWGEVKKLLASDGEGRDQFGYSVSISGDTVVVGAYHSYENGFNLGSAYIFERDQGGGNNWGEVKKLLASDGEGGDQFGYSVSISGGTVLVGAHWGGDSGTYSGSAYIFERDQGGGNNWGEVKKIIPSDGASPDNFGHSVSISGDTLIVGAYWDDEKAYSSGSAYVFGRNKGGPDNWGEVQKISASDGEMWDVFGNSVSISGYNLIVGAHQDDDKGNDSGSAYVYTIPNGKVEFIDIPPGYWAYEAIYKIYNAGITTGCSSNPLKYCPENPVIRTQMAVFLERAIHGSSFTPPTATGIFADVPVSYWAADWIEQFYHDGITGGCGTNPLRYCPYNNVTRAQMAIFLLRSKHGGNYTPPPATGIFADVPVSYWAAAWIEQLYNEGITTGCSTGPLRYCPENSVTRAQMAVFIMRTFGL